MRLGDVLLGADDDVVTSHFHFFDEGTRSQMINHAYDLSSEV